MSTPLVSVIVPACNVGRYLRAALQSIFDQDYRPFEVIVVDDGSSDDSAEIARSYEEVRVISQAHQGVAAARNAGIAPAGGEFIAFFDGDDLWLPGKLSLQIDCLRKNPEIGYCLARQRLFLEPGVNPPSWVRKEHLVHDQVGYLPSMLAARKSLFVQIGVFDSSYPVGEDTDWFFRAKEALVPMAILPQVLLAKRIHDANLSSQVELGHERLLQAVRSSMARRRSRESDEGR